MSIHKTSKEEIQALDLIDDKFMIHCVINVEGDAPFDETKFLRDAHTHGLADLIGTELQITLAADPKLVSYLINTIAALAYKNEWDLSDGDILKEVIQNNFDLKLFETTDCEGKPIMRILLPDPENKFGKEAEAPYCYQLEDPYQEKDGRDLI